MHDDSPPRLDIAITIPVADREAAEEEVRAEVAAALSAMGLEAADRVEVMAGDRARVTLNGAPAALSPRRMASIHAVFRGFPGYPRLEDAAPAQELAEVVRATLWANLTTLVRLELDRSAEFDSSTRAVLELLAWFGAAPGDVVDYLEPLSPGTEPALAAHEVLDRMEGAFEPVVTLSIGSARALANEPPPPHGDHPLWRTDRPAQIRKALFNAHGLRLLGVRSKLAELPDGVVRIGVGKFSATYRLVPDGTAALDMAPAALGGDGTHPVVVDPLYGEQWTLVETERVPEIERRGARFYWNLAYLARAVQAEVSSRAALFVSPDRTPWLAFNAPVDREAQRLFTPLRRCLAAEGISANLIDATVEAIVGGLASGESGIDQLVGHVRHSIGSGVLGPLPQEADFDVVSIDQAKVTAALRASDPTLFLPPDREPTGSVLTVVLVCPAQARADIARLARPLWPMVVAVSDEELPASARPMFEDLGRISRAHASPDPL